MATKITKTIQVKRPLSAEAKDNLLKDMVIAKKELSDLKFSLDELKEREKERREQIAEQQSNILSLIAQYETGFMPENVECEVKYCEGKTQFINIITGDIENECETTDKEQLMLNNNAVDAEDIIRQDNEENG